MNSRSKEGGAEKDRINPRGPLNVSTRNGLYSKLKRIGSTHPKEFWANPDLKHHSKNRGCHVFALTAGQGFSPWYIGKTCNALMKESFTDHKRLKYNEVLTSGRKGKPVMFFGAPSPGIKNKPLPRVVDDLETWLIQSAVRKNPDLMNGMKTKIPQWGIRGVIGGGKGKAGKAAGQFRALIGAK